MANTSPPPNKSDKGEGKRPRKRKPQPDDKFEWRKATRTLTFWILIIIGSWIIFRQLNLSEKPEKDTTYTDYRRYLESEQIASAEIIDHEFHGKLKNNEGFIITTLPLIDREMLAEWDSMGIDYQFKEKTTSWLGYLITSILPWVIIIGFWIFFMRRMQGGGAKGVFSFGKSRAKLMVESKLRITFKDVAGCDEAKEELREVIEFLRDPKKFSRLGGRIPKGALLLGPPGTGKTLLARAIAGEAEVPFFQMSGADFVEMFVGVGAARVRDLFEQGKKSAPCIIFIDEIDAVGRHRGAGLGGGHDEREQTLNQLLVEMDGFESNEGVILIAATNRPDVLDPALTRPGRFDRQIVVDRPDVRGREGILKVHARNIPLAGNVRLDILAKGTPGLAGADLANIVNEAALLAARRNADKVSMPDFEEAKDKVMMGAERRSMLISNEEKKQTAYHEAGHVLVAKMSPGSDPVHKVTIIPRGRALGLTHYLPIDEKHNYSRTYINQNLTHLLGGRAAEKLIFNELSTGAGNDIERATEIARKMVCEWGMSDKVGPVALGRKNSEVFLGRDFAQQRDFSEQTAQLVDAEIRNIVADAERRAEKILRENRSKLKALAEALLDREILDREEIEIVIKGGSLPPVHHRLMDSSGDRKAGTSESKKPRKPVTKKGSPAAKTKGQVSPRSQRTRRTPAAKTEAKSTESPAKSRRRFAKDYGIASSRDPGNRRPTARQMSIGTKNDSTKNAKSESKTVPRTTSPRKRTSSVSTRKVPPKPGNKKDESKLVLPDLEDLKMPELRSFIDVPESKPKSSQRENHKDESKPPKRSETIKSRGDGEPTPVEPVSADTEPDKSKPQASASPGKRPRRRSRQWPRRSQKTDKSESNTATNQDDTGSDMKKPDGSDGS